MKQFIILSFLLSTSFTSFTQEVNAVYEKGILFIEQNELDSAIQTFTRAAQIDKYHTNSFYNLGVCYMMKGEYNSSIPFFNRTILLDSNNNLARFNRAAAYSKTNNFLFAIFDYEYYIQKVPNDSQAYYNKAMVYLEMSEKENAFVELNKAINLSPYYKDAIFERALIYREKNDYSKALKDIESCMLFDKTDTLLLINQADLNFLLGNYDKAEKQYLSLFESLNTTYYHEQIAYSRMYAGKNWPSIEVFAELIKQNSTNYSYYLNRAIIYINIDKNQEAESDLTKAISLNPKALGKCLNLRGIARYNQKSFNEACFDWQQASNLHNDDGKLNLEKYCEKRDE